MDIQTLEAVMMPLLICLAIAVAIWGPDEEKRVQPKRAKAKIKVEAWKDES